MRKTIIRLALIALFAALGAAATVAGDYLLEQTAMPRRVVFELPLPPAIASKYSIPENPPEIEKVIIAGFFSDWNPDDDRFAMTRTASNRFEINLPFNPGANQYKFVVHLGEPYYIPIWSQDKKARRQVDDAFGGVNSVIDIPDVRTWRFVAQALFFGASLLLLLLTLLEPLLTWFMARRLPFRLKLVISMAVAGFAGSVLLLVLTIQSQRELIRESVIDQMAVICQALAAEGVDWGALDDPENIEKLSQGLKRNFYLLRSRQEQSEKPRNNQSIMGNLCVVDTNFQLLAYMIRRETRDPVLNITVKKGLQEPDYFTNIIYGAVFSRLREGNRLPDRIIDVIPPAENLNLLGIENLVPITGQYAILYPVFHGSRVAAYIGHNFQTKLFVSIIIKQFVTGLLLMGAGILLAALLLLRIGTIVTGNLRLLLEGIRRVQKGDLGHSIEIVTGDEFAELSDSYNYMREGLRATDRLKEEFLANTSHELRTPLNGIIGITESVMDGGYGTLPDYLEHPLSIIRDSGRILTTLVNSILDYSRIRAGKSELSLSRFQIDDAARVVVDMARGLLHRRNIELRLEIPQGLPPVVADKDKVRQVLTNLVGNAVKFTREGSVVISARRLDRYLEISVKDTGIGMEEKDIGKVFKPFHQLDGSADREFGGTGLGLTITRSLVELHHGVISVKSAPGKGSVFSFTLPLDESVYGKADQNAPDAAAAHVTDPRVVSRQIQSEEAYFNAMRKRLDLFRGSGERVLAVDDDPANLEVLRARLQMADYTVDIVQSARAAFDALRDKQYDLVLLDLMMPGMDGMEFLRRKSRMEDIRSVPVMVLSAKTSWEDKSRCLDAGADDFLAKPVDKEELLWKVHSLFHREKKRGKDTAAIAPSQTVEAADQSKGDSILIVDDEPVNLEALSSRLKLENFHVIMASDAMEGLAAARTNRPDLIILDVMMPRMTGYEFCEIARTDPALEEIPIIMLTARSDMESKLRGMNSGADDYIAKPFDRDELMARIRSVLRSRRLSRELSEKSLQLETANEELKKLNLLKSELIANVSHELRTPVTTLLGGLELLASGDMADADESDIQKMYESLYHEVKWLKKVINNFVVLSFLEKGSYYLQPVRIGTFLKEFESRTIKKELKDWMTRKKITVKMARCRFTDGSDLIKTDLEYLRHLVFELVHNAVVYNREEGTVQVSCRRRDSFLEIEIRDTGTGISEEDRLQIFERFFRGSDPDKLSIPGLGLGLAVCRSICRLLSIRIDLQSIPGTGTTVTLSIPAADTGPAAAEG